MKLWHAKMGVPDDIDLLIRKYSLYFVINMHSSMDLGDVKISEISAVKAESIFSEIVRNGPDAIRRFAALLKHDDTIVRIYASIDLLQENLLVNKALRVLRKHSKSNDMLGFMAETRLNEFLQKKA